MRKSEVGTWYESARRAIAIPAAVIQCVTMVAMLGIVTLFFWQSKHATTAKIEAATWREKYRFVIIEQLGCVDRAIRVRKLTDATFMLNTIGLYIQEQAPNDEALLREFRKRVDALIMEADNGNPAPEHPEPLSSRHGPD